MNKPVYKLILSDEDNSTLQTLLSKGHLSGRVHARCQALLWLDAGRTSAEIASLLGFNYNTITNWKKHYLSGGLDRSLYELARSGRPPKFDGDQRASITALACSEAPDGRSRWTLRLLAERIVELTIAEEISHGEVKIILKKTNSSLT